MELLLFPLAQYWWLYTCFVVLVCLLLAVDLGFFHREAHVVSIREAGTWSVVWICLALLFNSGLYYYGPSLFAADPRLAGLDHEALATQVAMQFLAGFLVEKSLAVDNIFVFVVVFTFFGIPGKFQHRVLFFGIIGALVLRSIFIALGSVLLQYHAMVLFFGALLILTGVKTIFAPERSVDPSSNIIIRLLRKWLPITDTLDGQRFITIRNGKRFATPLLLALVFVEITDLIFAVDSVPAIFSLTKEPFIVFTSNVFAILGLRSLYFLLAGVYDRFHLLKYGLGAVLIFVGLKMVWLNQHFGGKFPIGWSLAIIATLLGCSVIASLATTRKPIGTC